MTVNAILASGIPARRTRESGAPATWELGGRTPTAPPVSRRRTLTGLGQAPGLRWPESQCRRTRDALETPGHPRAVVIATASRVPVGSAPGSGRRRTRARAYRGPRRLAAAPWAPSSMAAIPLRLPVTALSANARVGDRGQCLTAGMDDFSTSSVWRSSSTTYRRADCPKHRPGGFPREPGDADLGRNSAQSNSRLEPKRRARSAGRDRNPFPRCGAAAFGALSRTVPSFEADALHRAGRIAGLLLALISSQEG